jgi:AcrR family transcriptional regulator
MQLARVKKGALDSYIVTSDRDSSIPASDPAPRRPADAVESAALDAAREVLATKGVKRLTIEGVSARTGIAKTTLYRRWRSKEDLALAVMLEMARTATSASAGPNLRSALVGYVGAAIAILRTTPMGRVMQGLASDLATDPVLATRFRDEVVMLRQRHLADLLTRAMAEQQLRPDLDPELLQDLLFGPVYYRLLFSGRPLDDALAEQIVDAVLPTIVAAPAE